MAVGLKTAGSQRTSLADAAVDLLRVRRTIRSTGAQPGFPDRTKTSICRRRGMAAEIASFTFANRRAIFHLHAPRRCRDGQLYRSHSHSAPSRDATHPRLSLPGLGERRMTKLSCGVY